MRTASFQDDDTPGNCITIGVDSPIRTVLFYRPPHRRNACVSVIETATVR